MKYINSNLSNPRSAGNHGSCRKAVRDRRGEQVNKRQENPRHPRESGPGLGGRPADKEDNCKRRRCELAAAASPQLDAAQSARSGRRRRPEVEQPEKKEKLFFFFRLRNLARLRTAMDQSYKQQNGELLFWWIREDF